MLKIKVCCISSMEEAQVAIEVGASAIGLVGHMPSGPGPIPDDLIAEIAAGIPAHIDSFLLTSETQAAGIIEHHKRTQTRSIQMVDTIALADLKAVKNALPDIRLVQVIHVTDESALDQAHESAPFADALLLDSGNPNASIKELGGTGRTHNWDISRQIVKSVNIPVFLAGGLNPENVGEAIRRAKPYGVDVCSGLRREGKLVKSLLDKFITNARST